MRTEQLIIIVLGMAVPAAIAAFVYSIVPKQAPRNYGTLIVLSVAVWIPAWIGAQFMNFAISATSNVYQLVSYSFLHGALVEQLAISVAFLIWFLTIDDRQPKDAMFGIVAAAMVFTTVGNGLLGQHMPLDRDSFIFILLHILVTNLSIAASAFVIGVWTSVGLIEHGYRFSAWLLLGLAIAVVAEGLWNFGIHVGAAGRSTSAAWLVPILGSILVQVTAIAFGIRRLNHKAFHLVWPPSFRN